jgi:sugar phosphate isomerase/epimerase
MKKIISLLLLLVSIGVSAQKGLDKIGIVSYTYRNSFPKNFEATLDTIKALGINNIEFSNLFGQTPEKIRAMLDARGMYCTSYGVSYDDAINKTHEIGRIANVLGAEFVRVAWLALKEPLTAAEAEKVAQDFNTIGSILLSGYDLTFCYHNHGYEFGSYEGGTLFDLIVKKTDPRYVSLELDLLWAHIADANPAELIKKYPDRFRLMHVKDLKKGAPHGISGKTDINNDVALGTGEVDIAEALKAARKSNIRYYYIEDESTNVNEQVPVSIKYLREKLK